MKNWIAISLVFLTACVTSDSSRTADVSAQFEQMKSMRGVWTSTPSGNAPGESSEVEYRLTAGDSVLVETLMRGTPHEMMTMYHLDHGALVLTHYCALGTHPTMLAEPSESVSTVSFACTGGSNFVCGRDRHMHAAAFEFVDRDQVRTEWSMRDGDQIVEQARFDLARKKN